MAGMIGKTLVMGILAGSLAAGQAAALSCAPNDLVEIYERSAASEQVYLLLKGWIMLPEDLEKNPKSKLSARGQFSGAFFDGEDFGEAFEGPLEVEVICLGPWCGALPTATPAIYVLALDDETSSLRLTLGPCGGAVFPVQAEEDLREHLRATQADGAKEAPSLP